MYMITFIVSAGVLVHVKEFERASVFEIHIWRCKLRLSHRYAGVASRVYIFNMIILYYDVFKNKWVYFFNMNLFSVHKRKLLFVQAIPAREFLLQQNCAYCGIVPMFFSLSFVYFRVYFIMQLYFQRISKNILYVIYFLWNIQTKYYTDSSVYNKK